MEIGLGAKTSLIVVKARRKPKAKCVEKGKGEFAEEK